MTWQFPKMTRRTFLKGAGASTFGVTLFRPDWIKLPGPAKNEVSDWGQTWKTREAYSICNYCSSFCSVRATVEQRDGQERIVKLGGNPRSTLNGDKLCARGQSGFRQVYSVDRIKTPLIRVAGSKRGEWSFRSVSWDEAYAYIAKKSKAIKPYEWTVYGGWSTCSFYVPETFNFTLANEIPNLITSPTQNCVFNGHLGTNSMTGNYVVHGEVIEDYGNSDYIIACVGNASIGGVSTCRAVRFAEAKEKRTKVVVLDPRASETASKADEWLQVRPGSDLAFMLAMLRELMHGGHYHDTFVRIHSNLPFLCYRDEHNAWQLYRSAKGEPAVVDAVSGRVRFLPPFSNRNDADVAGRVVNPALQTPDGFTRDGKAMVTVFQAQMAGLENYTPEWAEKITSIPAPTIRRIAAEFGAAKQPLLQPGWSGARYGNMQMLRRTQALIQGLVGGIDRPGGWLFGAEWRGQVAYMQEHIDKPGFPPMGRAGMPFVEWTGGHFSDPNNFSHGFPAWSVVHRDSIDKLSAHWAAMPTSTDVGFLPAVKGELSYKGKPYQAKAILLNGTNPMRDAREKVWRAALSDPALELVVVMDVMASDTAAYADVILPESSYLERDEPSIYGNGVNPDEMLITRNKAVEPLFDTQTLPDVFLKLTGILSGDERNYPRALERYTGLPARRLVALTEKYRADKVRDPFNQALRRVRFEAKAAELRVSSEHLEKTLREQGVYPVAQARNLLDRDGMPWKRPLPTPSGRAEFFSNLYGEMRDKFALHDNAFFDVFATYIPPQERASKPVDAPLENDEFFFTFGMVPTVSHCSPNNDFLPLVGINAFRGDVYHGVWIHPDRAKRLGIRQGQRIELRNAVSGERAEASAYLTHLTREDTLFMYSGFGAKTPALRYARGVGTALNQITGDLTEPVSGGTSNQEYTVRVRAL
ncbi:MAG: molybdopterin-dependent oxidoreductase [Acidihalobacter sp.]